MQVRFQKSNFIFIGFLFVLVGTVSVLYLTILQKKNYIVGISQWHTQPEFTQNVTAFKRALTDAGYIEGKNIQYLERNPAGNRRRQGEAINSFLRDSVDLIYAITTVGTSIAKEKTQFTPIVFSMVAYPEEIGLIQSQEHSGNNLVGIREYVPAAKQLALFKYIIPDIKTIGFVHRQSESHSTFQFAEFERQGLKQGIEVIEIAAENLGILLSQLHQNTTLDALYSACDDFNRAGADKVISDFSRGYFIPNFSCSEAGVRTGALAASIPSPELAGYLAGQHAARILSGSKPTNLQTIIPETEIIAINLSTAKNLGISIPSSLKDSAAIIIGP